MATAVSQPIRVASAVAPVLLAIALSLTISGLQVDVLAAQSSQLRGTVIDAATEAPIADVTVRVEGTVDIAVTDFAGRFVINNIPSGELTLRFEHLAYGTHSQRVELGSGVGEIQVRLSREAIELQSIDVVGQTTDQRQRRARGSSQRVVGREQIERAIGTSRHLGDVIRQTMPGINVRESNAPTANGNEVCIEFRGSVQLSLMDTGACKSPLVFVDGVQAGNPTLLYAVLSLETLEQIEILPPGEAGARYGGGSLHGVMLITTQRPGRRATDLWPAPGEPSLRNFDWDQDTAGHDTRAVMLGAFAGNAVGLMLGVVAARQCIAVDERGGIVATCAASGTALAGLAALALPAVGGALLARQFGGTDTSIGRWVPAVGSAILVLVPGYAFSLSDQNTPQTSTAQVVGGVLLGVGVPALLSVADRLFRDLR
jgi:hypothetical protein